MCTKLQTFFLILDISSHCQSSEFYRRYRLDLCRIHRKVSVLLVVDIFDLFIFKGIVVVRRCKRQDIWKDCLMKCSSYLCLHFKYFAIPLSYLFSQTILIFLYSLLFKKTSVEFFLIQIQNLCWPKSYKGNKQRKCWMEKKIIG